MRDDQVRDYKLDEHEERLAALEAAVFGSRKLELISSAIDRLRFMAAEEQLGDKVVIDSLWLDGYRAGMRFCVSYLESVQDGTQADGQ